MSSTLQTMMAGKMNETLPLFHVPTIRSTNMRTNPYTGRRKRRYIDTIGMDLSPQLIDESPEAECYTKLRKLERTMDVAMAKRHNYILHKSKQRQNTLHRVLRIALYNTFKPNKESFKDSSWMFRIQADLLHPSECQPSSSSSAVNNEDNSDSNKDKSKKNRQKCDNRALTEMLHRVTVKLNAKALNYETEKECETKSNIDWRNCNSSKNQSSSSTKYRYQSSSFDGIEINRKGYKNCDCTIRLYLKSWSKLYTISDALGNLLGLKHLSKSKMNNNSKGNCIQFHNRTEILHCLGEYCRVNNLIRNDNSMGVDCDSQLSALLGGQPTIYLGALWDTLTNRKHISPAQPITIHHLIKVEGTIDSNTRIYDVLVQIPNESFTNTNASKIAEMSDNVEVAKIDEQISDLMTELSERMAHRELLASVENDPIATIDVMVQNQRQNLQTIAEFCDEARQPNTLQFNDSLTLEALKRYDTTDNTDKIEP